MNICKFCSLNVVLGLLSFSTSQTAATSWMYTTVYGGPQYSSTTGTGFQSPDLSHDPRAMVNNSGQAVGYVTKYIGGTAKGSSAFRWNDATIPSVELNNLGTSSSGFAYVEVYSINDIGTAVGSAEKYVGGVSRGWSAVRWDASETVATELGHLGTSPSGIAYSQAYAINDANTAVGYAPKYINGAYRGPRAVRWDAGGTAATELGHLGTGSSGGTGAEAYVINDAGIAAGYAEKYDSGGNYQGERAVRWDASETVATELGHLGTDSSGYTETRVAAINDAGTTVGWANKPVSGVIQSSRAVRWDAGGTAATELGALGTNSVGRTVAYALAINAENTAAGWANKYDSGGNSQGQRAVRWDGTGTNATELGILGADSLGSTSAKAYAINDANIAVGYVDKYDDMGNALGQRSVYWGLDNVAFELNNLIHPASGWLNLMEARAISNTGWVTGYGTYDPDGMGGDAPYTRMFLLNINHIVNVPEPTSIVLFGLSGLGLGMVRLRRKS